MLFLSIKHILKALFPLLDYREQCLFYCPTRRKITMLQSGNIIKFKHLSNFKTKSEFDQHIYNFLQDHAKDFTKGELEAFKVLVQYSIKYKGVANARIAIFTKTSHENNNGYGFSRSTFERMLKKAVKLGILTIHSTNKVTKGGKGHNVYVFNRYDVQDIQEEVKEKKKPSKLDKIKMLANAIKRGDDRPFKKKLKYVNSDKLKQCKSDQTPCDSKQEQSQTEKEANIFKANNNNINKRTKTHSVSITLDSSFVGDWVPKEFVKIVKPFMNDAKTIEEFWRTVKINTYKYKEILDKNTILGVAIDSFRQTYRKLHKLDNPFAWFTGVLQKKLLKVLPKESDSEEAIRTEMVPDWLQDYKIQDTKVKRETMTEERKREIWEQVQALNVK